jgi:hypothetical protein
MHSSSNCVAIDRQMAWVSVGCLLNHSKGEAEGNQVVPTVGSIAANIFHRSTAQKLMYNVGGRCDNIFNKSQQHCRFYMNKLLDVGFIRARSIHILIQIYYKGSPAIAYRMDQLIDIFSSILNELTCAGEACRFI